MDNDAIIFDIDGTLWNACPASAKGWNIGLEKLGIEQKITSKQIENVAGNSYEKCIDILLPGFQEKYPELLDTLNSSEIEVVKSDGGKFYDGVINGIKALASSYKIFLVSNCQDWYMELFLKFSGLEPVLTGFDCHGMSGLPKHKMLKRIASDYALINPVYIGDTEGDESAAKLANMDFIHATYGFGKPQNEVKSFDSFDNILKYLEVSIR